MAVPIEVEGWIWYSIAMLAVTARFISRYVHLRSIKRFQLEDYLMALATCLYTILIVLLIIVSEVQTNLIAPEDIPKLDTKNIADRVRGSKIILVVETCMCCVIWLCKSCILLLYYRLTFGLTQHIMVKVTGVFVSGSFIIMMILYFGVWCRPFSAYWQTPTPNIQCATATHHLITNFTFNLTSDLLILSIPLPLLIRSTLPIPQKLALSVLFSAGLFVVACAIVSKYYSFRQPFSPVWIFWYTREASTAMVITNMTHIWTGLRHLLGLGSFTGESDLTGSDRRDTRQFSSPISPGDDEERTRTTGSRASKRMSAPFADLGGLIASHSSPSISSERPKSSTRAPSHPPILLQAPPHKRSTSAISLPIHRSSWLGTTSTLKEQSASANYSNLDLSNPTDTSKLPAWTSPLPSPTSLTDMQMLRNPAAASAAAAAEKRVSRGRGRVDSITALGLPDYGHLRMITSGSGDAPQVRVDSPSPSRESRSSTAGGEGSRSRKAWLDNHGNGP